MDFNTEQEFKDYVTSATLHAVNNKEWPILRVVDFNGVNNGTYSIFPEYYCDEGVKQIKETLKSIGQEDKFNITCERTLFRKAFKGFIFLNKK